MSQPQSKLPETVSDEVLRQIGEKAQNYIQEAQKVGIDTDNGRDLLRKGQRLKEVYLMYVEKRKAVAQNNQTSANFSESQSSHPHSNPNLHASSNGTQQNEGQLNQRSTQSQPIVQAAQVPQQNQTTQQEQQPQQQLQPQPQPQPQPQQQPQPPQSQETTSQQQSQQQSGASNSLSSSVSIRQYLTEEQTLNYNKMLSNHQEHAQKLVAQHGQYKKSIELLNDQIRKNPEDPRIGDYQATKEKLLQKLKEIAITFRRLEQMITDEKKRFYIECANANPALKQFLQARQLQAQQAQQQQAQQQQAQQQQAQQQQAQQQQAQQQQVQQQQVQQQQVSQQQVHQPPQAMQQQVNQQHQQVVQSHQPAETQQHAQQQQPPSAPVQPEQSGNVQPLQQTSQPTAPPSANGSAAPKVIPVNAAASSNNQNVKPHAIFKQSPPNIPLSDQVHPKEQTAVSYDSGRPTVTGGSATGMVSLTTPAVVKIPPYEVEGDRVMSKRKLRELVKTVGVDEGDGATVIDGDVEELLLDLADDFIANVVSFGCRLAKHRKSENLETKDLQIHLERNWNIRVPGFSADEIRPTNKWNPSPQYVAKMAGIKQQAKQEQEQKQLETQAAAETTSEPPTKRQKQ